MFKYYEQLLADELQPNQQTYYSLVDSFAKR